MRLLDLYYHREEYKPEIDTLVQRLILEQCVVNLATDIEVFFKDIHAAILNIRYVKKDKRLIDLFYASTRNDFQNMDKASKHFNNELLKINLKDLIGKTKYQKLDRILLKRHVIVHNMGLIDRQFLDNNHNKLKLGDQVTSDHINEPYKVDIGVQVPITYDEVIEGYDIAIDLVTAVNKIFIDEYCIELVEILNRS